MAFPIIFANLPTGIQPLSYFDTMFNTVGNMGTIFCTATGSNTVALTPIANMPTVASYTNYQAFGFVASAASTGSVTLNVSGVGALPAYAADASTQLSNGSISAGVYYLFAYNSALNTGSGGFQLIGNTGGGGGGGGYVQSVDVQTFVYTGIPQTYTTPVGTTALVIQGVAGGGGGGAASSGTSGTAGGTTSVGTVLVLGGGQGGSAGSGGGAGQGGTGGSVTTATITFPGSSGQPGSNANATSGGGSGGVGIFGAGGGHGVNGADGETASVNTGAGGAGGSGIFNAANSGGGGGGGGQGITYVLNPAGSYTVTIGSGGAGGTSGSYQGGNGASGCVIIAAYVNTAVSPPASGLISAGTAGQLGLYSSSGTTITGINPAAIGASNVLLDTRTVSSVSNVNFDNTFITSAYEEYEVHFYAASPDTNGESLDVLLSSDNGSTFGAGSYGWSISGNTSSGTVLVGGSSQASIGMLYNSDNAHSGAGKLILANPNVAGKNRVYGFMGWGYTTGTYATGTFSGSNSTLGVINYIRLYASTGTFSGTFKLYGIR